MDITIYKGGRHNTVSVVSKDKFFDNELIISISEDKLSFKIPTIDYQGKTQMASIRKRNKDYLIGITGKIPLGEYNFDIDNSNEDYKVVYFDDF